MLKTKQYLHLYGGVDINPAIYGQKSHPLAQHPNIERDGLEIQATMDAIEHGLPVIGICRGAQLLCALHFGSLWQHTTTREHSGSHDLMAVSAHIPGEVQLIADVPASHHQVMNLNGIEAEYEVLAWAPFPTVVENANRGQATLEKSPEVVWFPETKCLAIQPHPEWCGVYHPFRLWLNRVTQDKLGFVVEY